MSTDSSHATSDPRAFVRAVSTAAAIGCAGYIATIFVLADLTVRDAARSPLTIASNILVALSFALLAVSLPGLVGWLGLPRWAGLVSGVGCAFVAATAWGTGTLAVHAAGLLTDAQMEQDSAWFLLFQAPQSLPCAVGFVVLGVAALRTGAAPRGAAVLLVVAGVVCLLPAYPPGALLVSLALIWTTRGAPVREARRLADVA